jgi:peptidoglycan/xylan/chitin deacetylase (PgdA/CDA1 family)
MPTSLPINSKSQRRMVRWTHLLFVAIMSLGFIAPIDAGASSMGTIGATYKVNVRACADLDCPEIGAASLGDAIEITGDQVNGFYPVLWYGREGFVYALYLLAPGEPPWFVEGSASCNQVALVFNIGVGYEPSQSILDTLVESDVPATMFPMGWWALEHPEYLQQLDEAGFVIGTHGDQPLDLTSVPDDVIVQDISTSVRTIESIIGREIDQYFTPYAAATDPRVRTIVSELGLLPVGWNVSANDFGADVTEDSVHERVMADVYPGAVIEFHLDGPATEQSTALALPRIIDDLRSQGLEPVTIPDLVIPCDGAHVSG